MLAAIIAPALGKPVTALVLDGDTAALSGRAAALQLGCLEVPVKAGAYAAMRQAEASHGWPVLALLPRTPCRGLRHWLDEPAHNCLAALPRIAALSAGLSGRWSILNSLDQNTIPLTALRTAPRLVLAYLQDLCRRRLFLPRARPGLLEAVLDDLEAWRTAATGQKREGLLVRQARQALVLPGAPAAAFALGRLLLEALRRGEIAKGPGEALDEHDGALLVPTALPGRLLSAAGLPTPDPDDLGHWLHSAGLLIGEERHSAQNCWRLSRDWWEQQRCQHQSGRQRLRVVS